jgi:hypothetical protein
MQVGQPDVDRGRALEYQAPALIELGAVSELTLTGGCYFNKQLGGSDGFTWMGIDIPISNCSS